MSMYEQQQMPMPMLTLSVGGGVSFCLTPTPVSPTVNAIPSVRFFHPGGQESSVQQQQQQQQQQNDESVYCMALESFTGTLRIQVKMPMQASLTPVVGAATTTTTAATTTPSTSGATVASEKKQVEQQQKQQQQQHGPSPLAISTTETAESPAMAVTAKVTPKPGSSDPSAAATASVSSAPRQEKKQDEIFTTSVTAPESSPMAAAVHASTTTAAAANATVMNATHVTTSASTSVPSLLSGQEKQQQQQQEQQQQQLDHSLKRISLQPDETHDDSSLFKRQKCSQFQVNDDDDDDVDVDESNRHQPLLQSQSSTLLAQEELTQTQFSSQMDLEEEEHNEYSQNLLETPPNDETNNNINHINHGNGGDNPAAAAATSTSTSPCLRTILENNHSRDSSTTSTFSSSSSSRTNTSTTSTSGATSTRNSSSILDEEQDVSEEEEEEEEQGSTKMDKEHEENKNDSNGVETKTGQEQEEELEGDTTAMGLDSPHTAASADSPERSIVSRSPLQQPSPQQTNIPLALPLICQEACPCPRWGHTMTDVGDGRLIVYGGQTLDTKTSDFGKTLNDLHVYNIKENKWYRECVNGGGADSSRDHDILGSLPRQWHTATFLPGRNLLICLGGEAANPKTGKTKTTDPVMVLDTEIMVWYPPVVSGDIPNGRSGHTICLLVQSQNNGTTRKTEELVLFGGVRGKKWLNSVSVLNTQTWVWRTPRLQGMAPRPRSYHSATAISNRIVIFGGNNAEQSFNTVHVLEQNVDNDGITMWRWTHPNVRGHPPKPRSGHSATLLADQKTICIFGGWLSDDDADDEDYIFEDSFLLDTEKWEWKPGPVIVNASSGTEHIDGNTASDTKRVGHASVLTVSEADNNNNNNSQKVLIFGGRAPGDRFTCDFKSLHLDPTPGVH